MALLMYMDGIIVTSNNPQQVIEIKKLLHSKFKIKDLGLLKYFLRLEVARSIQGILGCQMHYYALDILNDTV